MDPDPRAHRRGRPSLSPTPGSCHPPQGGHSLRRGVAAVAETSATGRAASVGSDGDPWKAAASSRHQVHRGGAPSGPAPLSVAAGGSLFADIVACGADGGSDPSVERLLSAIY